MPRRRPSVSMAVAATLVTVTTLLLAITGATNYAKRSDEEWMRLRRVTRAQTRELAVTLAQAVWNIDRAQIDRILDGQADVSQIESVIVEAAGRTHARVRDAERKFIRSDGRVASTGLLFATYPIVHEGEAIGTVRIYTTPRFIRQQLRAELTRTVITIVAIDVLLIVVVYLMLFRTVLKPIVEIERYAGAVSIDGGMNAPPIRPAPTKELENLRLSIESMVRLLDRRYAELQEEVGRRFESEERFRTIYESVNDAIFIHARDTGAILDVNARMTEMFGYTREEARTLTIAALSSGEGTFTGLTAVELVRSSRPGDRKLFEWHTRHKDGHLFWVEVSIRSALIDGVERVVAVVRDIEQRKDMEEQLRRSQTMSAMGALVAGVAHEVRNPLFGMSALLDAYAEEMSTPDLRELLGGLREQISRLTVLMRELLELGRPATIAPSPGSLSELIDEVLKSGNRAAAEAGVTLRSAIDPALPPIAMDRSRLRQVFENLIDNAVQHAPHVRNVTVDASQVFQAERVWVECRVEDDGRGFATGDLAHVFEPFFTRRERGVGLGLSIVQRIVEEHGGRVTAANRAEGGAAITVRLPG